MIQVLVQADRRGDAETAASLFTADAVLLPPGDKAVTGREAILNRYEVGFGEFLREFELRSLSLEVSGDLAVDRGETEGWLRWKDGRPPSRLHDKYLMTLTRQGEKWLIDSLIWNRVLKAPSEESAAINFILQHGSLAEQATADTLIGLIGEYDLDRWAYTKTVLVNDRGDTQARPVLSLSARYRHQKELLLSNYINAQIHWFLSFNPVATQSAITELRGSYPNPEAPVPTEAYFGLLAGYLEYQVLTELLGHDAAFRALAHWTLGDESWVYAVVLAETQRLGAVVDRHGLNY